MSERPFTQNGVRTLRVFITGAAGWIGSALTRELIAAGHEVAGLVRSDASAERVRWAGGTAVRGDLEDHDLLVSEATKADAVAHLAFTRDFDEFEEAIDNETRFIDRISEALEGTNKAFFAASGTPTTSLGHMATERDHLDSDGPAGARTRTANAVLGMSARGIRSGLVRMPRSVHGEGDLHGLIANLITIDRQLEVAAYVGDGSNRWPAVHISDAGRLFHLALEEAPAGSVLHAVGEEGVAMRDVAEVIARKTGLTASAVAPEQLGMFGTLLGGDQPASSVITRKTVSWNPSGPTLLEDLEAGHYTA